MRGLILLTGVAVAAAMLLTPRSTDAAIDMTGEWDFTVEGNVPGVGPLTYDCTLEITQTGDEISGDFDCGDAAGSFTGTIEPTATGADIDVDLTIDADGFPTVTAEATGSVASDGNTFSGEWESAQFGSSGTFDGMRDDVQFVKGDVTCDTEVEGIDALGIFLYASGVSLSAQGTQCASLLTLIGDVDCDGDVDETDGLLVLNHLASLNVDLPDDCIEIGAVFIVS